MTEREQVRQVTDYIANQHHKKTQKELKRARTECNLLYVVFMGSFMLNITLIFDKFVN